MKNRILLLMLVFLGSSTPELFAGGINTEDTKLLSQPAVSQNHIAFVYAGDLWIADQSGKNPHRLTSDEGVESEPFFSPDGQLVAFSAQYDGNTDVFIVPVTGGIPKRLTWHPGTDLVRGFTPDGKSVLFISSRHDYSGRYTQLFTISLEGGFPVQLKIPNAYKASYSPDGTQMAYTPLREVFLQWKNYRGGSVATIRIIRFSDFAVEIIPQPEGRCNDTDPMWIGDKIYFRSDRNGEFNIFSFDPMSQNIRQITTHEDFPVLNVSAGSGRIIYEQAGYLHLLDLSDNRSQRLQIGVAADLLELRPRYVKGTRYIRNADISPSGARAVFEFRGEIITVPEKKGDPRNLTLTTNAHERSPLWSPDGKNIAFFSDVSGEYELYVKSQDGEGTPKKFKLNGTGFYTMGYWSPDSKKITFSDNGRNLYWINIETGQITKIGSEYLYSPGAFGNMFGTWSPDSKWITYTLNTKAYFEQVFIYSLEQNKSYPITDGLSDVSNPVIDPSGKYIYFFSSTDAGPVKHWFDQSTADMRMTSNIYLATLRKDIESPLFRESDEEKPDEENSGQEEENNSKGKKDKDTNTEGEETAFTIDFEGINERIIDLPVRSGNYSNLQIGDEGKIYFLEAPLTSGGRSGSDTKLNMYDLKERKNEVILTGLNDYIISGDHKKILYRSGSTWGIISSSGSHKTGDGRIDTEAVEVRIDPVAEWQQIFDEAWRINRDYFYDPGMHGADWNAMKEKYATFLPHLSCRSDLNRVIRWMCSEVSVGHHRVGGGDYLQDPDRVGGGLLGADYAIENGRYRIKKIYGGLNWNPDLRSPLTEPGVNVSTGEYLLAVNGNELSGSINIYSLFENTSGKIVELTIGPNPNMAGSRKTKVVPVSNEGRLRNRDWVEGNLKKVDEATGGKVAYVYVPNTARAGHTYFKRYFFPQSHKDAAIVDERFNGGGLIADYYIDILNRPYQSYWNMRYGADLKTPSASIQGPKVMIIDETAGSGGDMLPWMFRKFKMGKLIGKRTWGGLVGTLGYPILMDGGYVSAPNLGIWTEDGFVVENVGVPPDIEVEQWPADVINGHDPQLEKAIEVILEELGKNPPKKPERPPYPVRVRK
ncbi:MAG: PD40 domain-containing protein [Bacteroidales bacterium]|nr:MAG: PD40 domain-containing protein [Bacteroidales bacterium]